MKYFPIGFVAVICSSVVSVDAVGGTRRNASPGGNEKANSLGGQASSLNERLLAQNNDDKNNKDNKDADDKDNDDKNDNTKATEKETEPAKTTAASAELCVDPDGSHRHDHSLNYCKESSDIWATLKHNATFYKRPFTGECGPNCRPSCITLMLDVDRVQSELTCDKDQLHECEATKCDECQGWYKSMLFDEHPKCFLEETRCLGPTLYENYAKYAEQKLSNFNIDMPAQFELEQCTSIPDGDLYCRFKDFPLVTPMEKEACTDGDCFNDPNKIYFEWCNVVEEEQKECDEVCENDKDCHRKVVEPFPEGWTTFVVSSPLPVKTNVCDDVLNFKDCTDSACFLQRVEIYYPPVDECDPDGNDCSGPGDVGCPHCHGCPLLSLGDQIGALEVVGFGDCIGQTCAQCDKQSHKDCDGCELDCQNQKECTKLASDHCSTFGPSPDNPDFLGNGCTFCPSAYSTTTTTDC